MYRTLNVGLMAGAALLLLTVQPAVAQDEHITQAVDHAQQAANHGGMGHAEILVQHANMALTHANMAPGDNPYTVAAIASLTDGVTHGNMDHAPIATGMVNTAVTSLQAAVHVDQALDHAMQAVTHGGMGHASVLVTHAGAYNLWFTLAVPPYESLEDTIAEMANRTGAEVYRLMPTIRFFKIGVNFDMVKNEGAADSYYSPDGYNQSDPESWNKAAPVTDFEIEVIRELQEDLPLEQRPFEAMTVRLGIDHDTLFATAQSFQERGIMRRYSAVLHHRRAGFKSNAMVVWKVPEERSVEVGNIMASSPWVTHCYERPTFPDWRYTHFTMIHATSKEKCEEVAADISEQTAIDDYMLLYSTREYKKTRVRYFV